MVDRRRALQQQFDLLEETLADTVAEGMRAAHLHPGLNPDFLSTLLETPLETPKDEAMRKGSAGAFRETVQFQELAGEIKGALDRFFINLARMGYEAKLLRHRVSQDVGLILDHVDRSPEERLARAVSYVKTALRSAIGRDSFYKPSEMC